ncbi:MAG: efflux RND transporter permease subunit [Phycisphaerales bacterium]|nr:efflux RND transporter permease subunit [Phycisphaerales bacterium]
MRIAAFGVRRPVVANLTMFAVLGAGLIFGLRLTREFFPEVRPTQVMIAAPYPGAAPDEVERSLAIKIEDRVRDLDDVKEINTTVTESAAVLRVEFREGKDIEAAVAEVKREIDALQDLPERSERITVTKLEPKLPAVILSLYGDADERAMKDAARRIREDLRLLRGMGDVEIGATRGDELTVEVRPAAMLEHGLSLPEVARRVGAAMREQPAGTVRGPTQSVSVRTVGAKERTDAVREVVVRADEGGRVLRLGEIADVREGFVDTDTYARLNGKPAVSLTVFPVRGVDVVTVADLVKAYAAGLRHEPLAMTTGERIRSVMRRPGDTGPASERIRAYELGLAAPPPPCEVRITTDLARFVVGRLDLLTRNAIWGGMLVFLTLVLLLNWRVSFWVAVGLIVAMSGTLAVMHLLGVSLNLLTMFGLIVVIGILVDDAIVVAENITARHEGGEAAIDAAINGTGQVGWPVVATVLTTVCAFLPLALIEGNIGDFLKWLPIVVTCALVASLLESLFILPAHMAHSLKKADRLRAEGHVGRLRRVESAFDHARDTLFSKFLVPGYLRALRLALRRRYVTLCIAVATLVASIGFVAGGRLEFIFFETEDAETINVQLRMPIGTPAAETDRVLTRIERAALQQPEVRDAFAIVGAMGDISGEGGDAVQSHLGQLVLELHPVERRERTSNDVVNAIRAEVGEIPGVRSLRFDAIGAGPGGPGLTFTVVGASQAAIDAAVRRVKEALRAIDGVFDVTDDADAGQPEIRLTLRDGASELGFTEASLGEQVRAAVFGLEAYTFPGEREDVDVRVTLPVEFRRSPAALERMFVIAPGGEPVPLGEIAHITMARSYATVRRLDGQRAVTVNAEVDRGAGVNPESVTLAVRPDLRRIEGEVPGVRVLERGRQQEVQESFSTLPIGMAVAAGLIYVILAWLFASYSQPLVVMTAIPFAIIGMIWGHLILGFSMTFLSLIGFVALSGVVVNDSLIFMDFFNQKRAELPSTWHAAIEAGRARLRPILLTTITTVLGLSPLMLEQSFQARFLIPMAITISFGLMSATALILVVLPCLLLILEDAARWRRILWTGVYEPPPAPPEPNGTPGLAENGGG